MLEIRRKKTLTAALLSFAIGAFSFAGTAHAQAPVCGDGVVEGGELCDGQYGCDTDCTPLEHWECEPNLVDGTAVCVELEGWVCDTVDPTDCAAICGDGIIVGAEECDDNNTDIGDGCSDICEVEADWTCTGEPSVCTEDSGTPTPVCGDGVVDTGEACDDGNTDDGDGCDSSCEVEADWTCTGEPSVCTEDSGTPTPVCGDGVVDTGEACDDGNTDDGDGCDSSCEVEADWTCTGEPSVCTEDDDNTGGGAVCGDGIVDSGEACDDGNTNNGDGCSSTCTVEPGWACVGAHSACTQIDHEPVCGNSFVEAGEECDGQAGCSDTCTWLAASTGGRIGSCASATSAGGLLAAMMMLMALSVVRRRQRARS